MLTITVKNRAGKKVDQFKLYGTWLESDTLADKIKGNGAPHVGNPWVNENLANRLRALLEADNVK
jgi:hypothetical protein